MGNFDVRRFDWFCREIMPELATFHTVADLGNRSQAAIKLGKTGPSVGKALVRLEKALKVELNGGFLIDHDEPRKPEPTDAGNLLREFCGKVLTESALFLDGLESLQRGSEIRLAITNYAWLAYGSDLESAYKLRRQDGTVNIGSRLYSQDKVWDEIEREVVERRADVGSYPPSRRRKVPPELSTLDWIEEEMVLVIPAKRMNLPTNVATVIGNLPEYGQVVHYDRSLQFDRTDTIEAYLKDHKILKQYPRGGWLLGVNTIPEIKDHLRHKGGVSFLPWPTVESEYRSGLFQVYRLKPQMRPRLLKVICRKHNSRPAVVDFMKAAGTMEGPRRFTPPESPKVIAT
jgi:DNA-binding transcriptional LysR family regulator